MADRFAPAPLLEAPFDDVLRGLAFALGFAFTAGFALTALGFVFGLLTRRDFPAAFSSSSKDSSKNPAIFSRSGTAS